MAALASLGAGLDVLVIILTGVAMGARNTAVRKLAVPDKMTTVLTLTLTGIAADSSLAGAVAGALLVPDSVCAALAICAVLSAAGAWAVTLRREATA